MNATKTRAKSVKQPVEIETIESATDVQTSEQPSEQPSKQPLALAPRPRVTHYQLPQKEVMRITAAWIKGGSENPQTFFENVLAMYPNLRTLDNVKRRLEKLGLITLPSKKYVLTESDLAFASEIAESVAHTIGHTTSSSPRTRKLLRAIALEILDSRKQKDQENTDETAEEEAPLMQEDAPEEQAQVALNTITDEDAI